MTLRHKLSVRIAACAWVALAVWWLEDERTPQALVHLAIAALWLAVSLRALIIVRDDTVYRRGLLGWDKSPLLLDELTAVSLRREAAVRRYPLVLRLSGAEGSEVSIECWAWGQWRELAHRAGHFARVLGSRRDDVTARLIECKHAACAWEPYVASTVGGRRAGPPPEDDLAKMGVLESVAGIAALFAFGFVFGLFRGWFRDDPEIGPLLPLAVACGAFFAIAGFFVLLWDKAKGTSNAERGSAPQDRV